MLWKSTKIARGKLFKTHSLEMELRKKVCRTHNNSLIIIIIIIIIIINVFIAHWIKIDI